MFNLTAKIANQPIMDGPFERHLRTDAAFQRVSEARQVEAEKLAAVNAAIIEHAEARKERETADAEAKLMGAMEDL